MRQRRFLALRRGDVVQCAAVVAASFQRRLLCACLRLRFVVARLVWRARGFAFFVEVARAVVAARLAASANAKVLAVRRGFRTPACAGPQAVQAQARIKITIVCLRLTFSAPRGFLRDGLQKDRGAIP